MKIKEVIKSAENNECIRLNTIIPLKEIDKISLELIGNLREKDDKITDGTLVDIFNNCIWWIYTLSLDKGAGKMENATHFV